MGSPWPFLPGGPWLRRLVLATLFLESVGGALLFDPNWGFDSYEITIPKKLSYKSQHQGVVSSLSYLLPLKGKNRVLHLWPKKFLLLPNLPVFSFTKQGQLVEDHPHLPSDCSYLGWVEGSQGSEATLTTCMGGLKGILNIDARYYQIEPLKPSSRFEHVVYLLKKEQLGNGTCGVVDEGESRLRDKEGKMARSSDYLYYTHQKYFELFMVFDVGRFRAVNYNVSLVVNDAILLCAIMDTYFQEISLRIQLKSLELWTYYNEVNIRVATLAEVLSQFVIYKRRSLSTKFIFDWAHLYVSKRYKDATGWSWGRVCEPYHGGSTSSFVGLNILETATWSTHELGHSLGMRHDGPYCQCKGKKTCIMGTGQSGFSNCSYEKYYNYLRIAAECLDDFTRYGYVVKRCGNKIVEGNEECDCGSQEDCKSEPCCGTDCKLKPGVNCSFGLCCHRCQFLPSGHVCRQEENECDLAEYCNGTSNFCPDDSYKQDGTPCQYEGFCFSKGCRSRDVQCRSVFGYGAKEAPHGCYEVINAVGDQYGNCEIHNTTSYKQCDPDNVMCGRLQCVNVKSLPEMPDHTILISTYLQADNVKCWGTAYHLSMNTQEIPDIGVINDGTSCGPNKVCMNSTCVDSSVLNFDCWPQKCNSRGTCNQKRNCHCRYGWAPPLCVEVGYGGSIDSGPPGLMKEQVPSPFLILFIMLLRLILFAISVVVVFCRQLIVKSLTAKPESSVGQNVTK
uniref:disintegrin and metalloproteinase domain-containing protein 30 n=1 Tax=Jaculus jaculus TaxID=51337 RepID=UPI001E1AF986|nr:disintegrin and metalloproteinase domain-containing protein 30 [Jaculus jaculus]